MKTGLSIGEVIHTKHRTTHKLAPECHNQAHRPKHAPQCKNTRAPPGPKVTLPLRPNPTHAWKLLIPRHSDARPHQDNGPRDCVSGRLTGWFLSSQTAPRGLRGNPFGQRAFVASSQLDNEGPEKQVSLPSCPTGGISANPGRWLDGALLTRRQGHRIASLWVYRDSSADNETQWSTKRSGWSPTPFHLATPGPKVTLPLRPNPTHAWKLLIPRHSDARPHQDNGPRDCVSGRLTGWFLSSQTAPRGLRGNPFGQRAFVASSQLDNEGPEKQVSLPSCPTGGISANPGRWLDGALLTRRQGHRIASLWVYGDSSADNETQWTSGVKAASPTSGTLSGVGPVACWSTVFFWSLVCSAALK
ncbi:hypothetical protein HPB47_018457, partial [Ixodes persulcatus]